MQKDTLKLSQDQELGGIEARIQRIEEVLTWVRNQPLPPLTINYEEVLSECKEALKIGAKLKAVKIYSDRTGCSLKEAFHRINSLR